MLLSPCCIYSWAVLLTGVDQTPLAVGESSGRSLSPFTLRMAPCVDALHAQYDCTTESCECQEPVQTTRVRP